jgi:hypothetical protein
MLLDYVHLKSETSSLTIVVQWENLTPSLELGNKNCVLFLRS